ncbi:MAG: helix-hairpin-helix domain-containing protein [Clostridiales bacterium]|nr:helix-hairpin-helix domain-containing protein [Clostridiales bacterium]
MRKYITCALIVSILALAGCGPDVDLILANGRSSAAEETISDEDAAAEESAGNEPEEPGGAEADGGVSADEPDTVCAYICGAVETPGVYEAESGSRVYALLELAGGMTGEADRDAVNLAREVTDGEMIYIPTEEEVASGEVVPESPGAVATVISGSGSTDASGKININTASAEELTALSGIGDSKAAAIVSYREEHGSFASTEEITNVSGIGDSTYEKIKDNITV